MTRSLRFRFFLTTWPVIVVSVASVAFVFARWTDVRLTTRQIGGPDPVRERIRRSTDSVAVRWAAGDMPDTVLRDKLNVIATRDSTALVVIDAHGEIVASTDTGITPRVKLETLPGPEPLEFVRSVRKGDIALQTLMAVSGWRVADREGVPRAVAYIIPVVDQPQLLAPGALRADARRTLWIAVLIASVLAALVSLLLARPILGQVGRLAAATQRVRGGDLAARINVSSDDELGRLEYAFNEMAASLANAAAQKRNLMHDVAHELRTPLTNIVAMLEAIEDGLRPADDATLTTLQREARLLTDLVGELQELNLAETGELAFELAPVDIVSECAAAIDAMHDAKPGVELSGPAREPVFAIADQRRLRQVLRNLLRNALTHTPVGGFVRVSVEERDGEVGILVRDSGRGIPADHLPLVWERFHRVDPARDRSAGGRGLGLAIVKQFVGRMGGRVAASSTEGKGATFAIWLKNARTAA